MTKEKAIEIIHQSAQQFERNLRGKQIMFIFRDSNNHVDYIEVRFRPQNFLHFTGVKTARGLSANDFYRAVLKHRLSLTDFTFNDQHTTDMKLSVLSSVMNIDKTARMVGNYIGGHTDLYTEKVTGTTTASLGLIQKNDYYLPNSVLKEDIRDIVEKPPGKIFLICKKNINDILYTQVTYKSKNVKITPKCLNQDILEKIDSDIL